MRRFPQVEGGRWQISSGGGTRPVWAKSGRELFYISPGAEVMAVAIQDHPTFSAAISKRLFKGPPFLVNPSVGSRSYDVSADGRFLIKGGTTLAQTDAVQIMVVENWTEELKRLCLRDSSLMHWHPLKR